MARDYGNNIEHSQITGFPSPAAEYAEKELSLDQKFDSFNPAIKKVFLNADAPLFGLKKGDLLLVLMGARPAHNDLIYGKLNGNERIFRFQRTNGVASLFPSGLTGGEIDDFVSGVVDSLHRDLKERDKDTVEYY